MNAIDNKSYKFEIYLLSFISHNNIQPADSVFQITGETKLIRIICEFIKQSDKYISLSSIEN